MTYPGSQHDDRATGLLAPADYRNPTPRDRYHLAVVGAGPAGLISAIGAAGLGARVALVERHRMGGDCLNVGCVPSKALLEFTHVRPAATFTEAFTHMRAVRAGIAPHDSVERYTSLGVDVFLGHARFEPDGSLAVDGTRLNARRIVLCSGARPSLPPIPGLAAAQPLTNETVFDLREPPASLGILGAGVIGCELATVFARLGVPVHLFDMAERVLPLESEYASRAVAASLERLGVQLHLASRISEVSGSVPAVVHTEAGEVAVDRILVALGRRPNTDDLGLDHAGIAVDPGGFIVTDRKLRTANRRVYAAGDCTARLQFTHHADAQARIVVQNALFAPTASIGNLVVPHCTYTDPEVASVGLSPEAAAATGMMVDVYEFDLAELDRVRTRPDAYGWARVVTRRGTDRIVGATVVAQDAGELIAPICVAMSNRLGLASFGRTMLAYPTRSEFLKRLADAYNRTRMTPLVSRLFAAWLRWFR